MRRQLEFVVGMMAKLDLVRWEDADPFIRQFEALDADSSGTLTAEDMLLMRSKSARPMRRRPTAARPHSHTRHPFPVPPPTTHHTTTPPRTPPQPSARSPPRPPPTQ